jgi:hypothetical protein
MAGRYRIRTWLRGNLPGPLSDLFPKGRRDCGNHEWHRATEETDRCYHCEIGVRSAGPPLVGVPRGTEELLGEYERSKAEQRTSRVTAR